MTLDIMYSLAACQNLISINDLTYHLSHLPSGGGSPSVSITLKDPAKGPVNNLMPIYIHRIQTLEDLAKVKQEMLTGIENIFNIVKQKVEADIGEGKFGKDSL